MIFDLSLILLKKTMMLYCRAILKISCTMYVRYPNQKFKKLFQYGDWRPSAEAAEINTDHNAIIEF